MTAARRPWIFAATLMCATLLWMSGFGVVAIAQTPQPLTLQQAEQIALAQHPLVQAAQYTSRAAQEIVRQVRSAYFPTAFGSLSGAEAENGSRIAAGGLNNPIIYDRLATGVTIGQLVTDFGRTQALVETSSLGARAQEQLVPGQRAAIFLAVDRAYFDALRAQAVERVARDTVNARQLSADQVSALAASNLKSGLDVSFAKVNLSTAQLLLAQAQSDTQRAFATLASTLGSPLVSAYTLVDEPLPPTPAPDAEALVAQALRARPEMLASRFGAEAALKFADAEGDLVRPSVAAVGAVGVTPVHQVGINDRYAAVGVNVNVPILNGGLFGARHAEASLRAQAAGQRVRDLENEIGRGVRIAWLDANTAFKKLDLTDQLLDQATQALDLAQARYDLGLSAIVELSQAQLNKTLAELEHAAARYEYQARVAALNFEIGARQ